MSLMLRVGSLTDFQLGMGWCSLAARAHYCKRDCRDDESMCYGVALASWRLTVVQQGRNEGAGSGQKKDGDAMVRRVILRAAHD